MSLTLGRWSLLSAALLAAILVPFFLYEEPITRWTQEFVEHEDARWVVGGVLGGLLATDVLLPIPSSLVGTAAGYLLGLWAGSAVTWTGMTAACLIGYLLGATAGREVTRRFVGEEELQRAARAQSLFGDWMVVIFRAVPVLAEASVLFAGVVRMPFGRFVLLATLSNLGIALTYSAVGAYALKVESFLLAFGAAIAVPGIAMLIGRFRT